jgi:hypothetical protein
MAMAPPEDSRLPAAARKLMAIEDWNLSAPGPTVRSRTRGGGVLGRPHVASVTASDETNDADKGLESSSEEEEEEEAPVAPPTILVATKKKKKKPSNTRILVEVKQLENAFSQFECKKCGMGLEMKMRTVCLATSFSLSCVDEDCDWIYHTGASAPTTIHVANNDNFERSTDYAVNVLFVLGFMSMGDGGVEAAKLLGLLGLPNDTTMETRSFGIIETRIGPTIQKLCDEIVMENLTEEVRMTMLQNATEAQPFDENEFNL